ncbi:MAG: VWA domain-containing protein [Faecalibacterium sp.]|nr:VWA domain-containing protein [Ruminococcus sp.]MCM1391349.1 VWA domain-containing protein [Ruminococcus sp.]MCM1484908.1 VWA domain-containing protein [Faecalibacterium sp.]
MFKKISTIFICILVIVMSIVHVNAADMEISKEYKSFDIVVVLDSSLSMGESDKDQMALDAIKMLVDMMPAEDTRVGIISFNHRANVLTKDTDGSPKLMSLETFADTESIRDVINDITYSGDTAIGTALHSATELLDSKSDNEHAKAIFLFTDGVDDIRTINGGDAAEAISASDEVAAVKWAKENECGIYCVGYNYKDDEGNDSMGKNGEGIEKIKNIASNSKGNYKAITSIKETEQLLIDFLAEAFNIIYRPVASIPGDGGRHECKFSVDPSVVEANIRISGCNNDSLRNGEISLFGPDGKKVDLKNTGNLRFNIVGTSASIKIIMPKSGDWNLVLSGIKGDDIKIGMLEHYKMNLTSVLEFPDGNPDGVAYANDKIGIKTWLTYDGMDINEPSIYESVTSAVATCVSRANPEDKKIIKLSKDGTSFKGEFIIEENSYYDITVRLDWDSLYRENTLTIGSSNKPLYLVRDIEDVKLNKKKSITINDIYSYVADDENDKIEASIASVNPSDVADVTVQGTDLVITGKKWSSALISLNFNDEQGNIVETTFIAKVNDPVAIAMIILSIICLLILIIVLIWFLKKASDRTSGEMKITLISEGYLDSSDKYTNTKIIYKNPNIIKADEIAVAHHKDMLGNGKAGVGGPAFGNLPNAGIPNAGIGLATLGNAAAFGNKPTTNMGGGTPPNTPPQFGGFNAGQNNPAEEIRRKEDARSDTFDEAINLYGTRNKKLSFTFVLNRFLEFYEQHMNVLYPNSTKYQEVEKFITQNFTTVCSRITLLGTAANGRNGIIFVPSKHLIPNKIKVHSPTLTKNKAAMNPSKQMHTISLSIPYGDKNSDGNIPCSHIEIKYFKNK